MGARENPIDLHYPYIAQDQVTIAVPVGEKVEATPQSASISLPQNAFFATNVKVTGTQVSLTRTIAVANVIYLSTEYPALKGFLDKVNATDQEQTVLERGVPGGGGQ